MIEEVGVPGLVLMENAGRGAAEWALERADELGLTRGVWGVVCGGGNNGGDGYVMARHLSLAGVSVALFELSSPDRLSSDAAIFREVCVRLGLKAIPWGPEGSPELTEEVSCWVDAVLGTGFQGVIRAPQRGALEAIARLSHSSGCPVIALDVPSGLDADSGDPAEGALKADYTLSFGSFKVGLMGSKGRFYSGEVSVIGLGVPVDSQAGD